jgi:hypothetical protein
VSKSWAELRVVLEALTAARTRLEQIDEVIQLWRDQPGHCDSTSAMSRVHEIMRGKELGA